MAAPIITSIDPAGFQSIGNPITINGVALNPTSSIAGLVGHWKFDEIGSSSVNDDSTNSNAGSIVGSPTWGDGVLTNAIIFSGTGQYVTIDGAVGYVSITADFSISIWAKQTSNFGTANQILTVGTSNDLDQELFRLNNDSNNNPNVVLRGNIAQFVKVLDTSVVGPDTGWKHYAVTYSSTTNTISLYLDGISIGSNTNSSLPSPTPIAFTKLTVGALRRSTAVGYFGGSIDELKIYNSILTAEEIRTLALNPGPRIYLDSKKTVTRSSDTVAHWKVDETLGTDTLTDSSPNSYNGTASSLKAVRGKLGNARTFSGATYSHATIDTAATNILNGLTMDFSFSLWFRTSYTGSNQVMLGFANSTSASNEWISMSLTTGTGYVKFRFRDVDSDLADVDGTVNLADGTWHHAVYTWKYGTGGNRTLTGYINGKEIGTTTNGAVGGGVINMGTIGAIRRYSTPSILLPWKGSIDDVRIYNRILSSQEVSDLYGGLIEVPITGYSSSIVNANIPENAPIGTDVVVEGFNAQQGTFEYSILPEGTIGGLLKIDFSNGAAHHKEIDEETDSFILSKIETASTTPSITIDQSVPDAFTVGSDNLILAQSLPIDNSHAVNKDYTDTSSDDAQKVTLVDGSSGTIVIGDAVALSATGTAIKADSSAEITAQFSGFAATDAAGTVDVYITGVHATNGNVALTDGETIFLSTIAGDVTNTSPVASGESVVRCGYAVSTTEVFINPDFMGINS